MLPRGNCLKKGKQRKPMEYQLVLSWSFTRSTAIHTLFRECYLINLFSLGIGKCPIGRKCTNNCTGKNKKPTSPEK